MRARLLTVFAAPLLLALVTIVGLVVALTGDGIRDVTSWVALCVPLLVVGWAIKTRRT